MMETPQAELLVPVSQDALYRVLAALEGAPHRIRELQHTRHLPVLLGQSDNPITVLVQQYNAWAAQHNAAVDAGN